ncbi:hypothetical protein AcW1_002148 [Taiwanofungus camphoratus]|nr:hypothetical protein AcW1_002148 [Antrodia cinnamomea]KAI0946092.1 hypothetical protein AcV7_010159 [Antrodia cinnamomea]
MDTVPVSLAPTPGFCIKSVSLQSTVCKVSAPPALPSKLDGPSVVSATITVPKGLKVFVNIAWDSNVPPPPDDSEEAIQRAMSGEEEPPEQSGEGWFVPVVVSEPREDKDKAGKPSVVLDCVYNSSLKSRALKDLEFKTFLIELAFQRIEAQHSLLLSRQIGTPNIRCKGELHPRTVRIPAALYPEGHPNRNGDASSKNAGKKLIEEIEVPLQPKSVPNKERPKGILKNSPGTPTSPPPYEPPLARPDFSWSKVRDGVQISIKVPKLTYDQLPSATLDLEPRRIILNVPPLYALDLDLDLSDAHIRNNLRLSGPSAEQALALKRHRDLSVDTARAEWKVTEGLLVVHA